MRKNQKQKKRKRLVLFGMLGLLLALAVFITYYHVVRSRGDAVPGPKAEQITVALYFADEQAMNLVRETRTIDIGAQSLEVMVLEELIKGPATPIARRAVPLETRVINVSVVDGVAQANFSAELVTRYPGGTAGERMTIMSIVYTLTELPGIERVQLLIEGRREQVMFGHAITYDPIGRTVTLFPRLDLDEKVDESVVWARESQTLAGLVTAVGGGQVTGAPIDIVVYANSELYLFSKTEAGYRLSWRQRVEQQITSFAVGDIDGVEGEEIIAIGVAPGQDPATGPSLITVWSWQEDALVVIASTNKEAPRLWAVGVMDVTGRQLRELVASNGQAMFVWEYRQGSLTQVAALSRFAGAIATATLAGRDYLAWRDANGVATGVFYRQANQWQTAWHSPGQAEWSDGVPVLGDFNADGRLEYGIYDLAGQFSLFNHRGERMPLPRQLQGELVSEANPVMVLAATEALPGILIAGRGAQVWLFSWP